MIKITKDADLKPSLIDLEASNMATGGKQSKDVQPERLSGKDDYCVYWIHTMVQYDFLKEGYIGITYNFKERMRAHKKSKQNYIINKAILKYGWKELIKEKIHDRLTLKEALALEFQFRPELNIGWNSQIGGNLGLEREWYLKKENKEKHAINTSIGTKLGILKNDSKAKRSERAKKAYEKNADFFKTIMKGDKNGRALLTENQVRLIKCKLSADISNREIAKRFNVKEYVIFRIVNNKLWKHVVCDSPDYK